MSKEVVRGGRSGGGGGGGLGKEMNIGIHVSIFPGTVRLFSDSLQYTDHRNVHDWIPW